MTKASSIKVINNNNSITLRFTYSGSRFNLNPGFNYNKEGISKANEIVKLIEFDIEQKQFDITLKKYKKSKSGIQNELPDIYEDWVLNILKQDLYNNPNYFSVLSIISKKSFRYSRTEEIINESNFASSTFNKRVSTLRRFYKYLQKYYYYPPNNLELCVHRNESRKINNRREPLSSMKINSFLDAIKNDKFLSKHSSVKHSFYYPFLYFIFYTGCRNQEVIGLRVKYVDLEKGTVEIKEVLARSGSKSTHARNRRRKETKTGKSRTIYINSNLVEILSPLLLDKDGEDLVFLSPKGVAIDDRMLQRRIFKPVMQKLGFGNKDLYVARHSFATRALLEGIPVTEVAYIMGNTPSTIYKHYANIISIPKRLPAL